MKPSPDNPQKRLPKKNSKANVGRNNSIYFVLGLVLMLFFSYQSINYRSFDKSNIDKSSLNLVEDNEVEIPIIDFKLPPPPPPPVALLDFEPTDDDDVEETLIEPTDIEQNEEIKISEVDVIDEEEDVEVPFSLIENVPEYPGCEKGSNTEKRKCMSAKIAKFVQRKFNTDLAGDLGLSGRQRISVIFKIDKKGNVTGVRSRAPHPRLEKEAARVINLLPKMKPGRQRGKAVVVPYSLPITFQVQD